MLEKAKREDGILRFVPNSNVENFKVIRFNDASIGNLSAGSSRGGYIIYLGWDEIGECSLISWQSKKSQRVVKSAIVNSYNCQL